MADRASGSQVKQLQLARAARVAGEAFGWHDAVSVSPSVDPARLFWLGSLASAFVGIVAAVALYTGL